MLLISTVVLIKHPFETDSGDQAVALLPGGGRWWNNGCSADQLGRNRHRIGLPTGPIYTLSIELGLAPLRHSYYGYSSKACSHIQTITTRGITLGE